jgi:hypothetical protein
MLPAPLNFASWLLMAVGTIILPADGVFAAPTAEAAAPRIRLKIDTSNAEATLKLLEPNVSPADVVRFKALPATADLIRRAKGWNLTLTPDDLVSMIEKAKGGEKSNVFNYDLVLSQRDKIRDLISRAANEQPALEQYLTAELAPYLPAGRTLDIKVIMILGGFSAGFILGSPDTMYTGAHFYDGDFSGFRTMLLHEAFHNVQLAARPSRDFSTCLSKGEHAAYNVLDTVFKEGTAEHVADLWKPENDSPYNARGRKNMEVNANSWRLQAVERLINHMVVSAVDAAERQPDPEVLSIILTDWNWNNPGYYYGYRISGALAKKHGKARIAQYLTDGPQTFFKDYLAVKKDAPSNFFGPRFAEIVETLDAKVKTCPVKKG